MSGLKASSTLQQNDSVSRRPDEKLFVATFLKGLCTRTFREAIFIHKPATKDEIRVRADKHTDDEEAAVAKQTRDTRGNRRGDNKAECGSPRAGEFRDSKRKQTYNPEGMPLTPPMFACPEFTRKLRDSTLWFGHN